MFNWEVLYRFIEVIQKEIVHWFKSDFEAVRDGVGHTAPHREVGTHIDVVRKAIEDSDLVTEDKSKKNRKCYYCYFKGDAVYSSVYMKVVVEYRWFGKLSIVTAYFIKHLPKEKIIWNKQ